MPVLTVSVSRLTIGALRLGLVTFYLTGARGSFNGLFADINEGGIGIPTGPTS
jgi:hypothetical protein